MTHLNNPLQPPAPLQAGDRLIWEQLHGCSLALAISQLARQNNKLVVVVTPDQHQANQLEDGIRFFNSEQHHPILSLADWETLPYDHFSPHQDIISQRLLTLYQLPKLTQGLLIIPITTLLQRLPPRTFIESYSFVLKQGEQLSLDSMRNKLEHNGYRYVSQVMEHGEYTIRGSIFDLFPMGSMLPFRIDLFDQEVDSIRTFDPETQRTLENLPEVQLLPAREYPLTDAAITHFRQSWREQFSGNPTLCPLYQNISQGASASGIEYYLPLFFESTHTLFDYLPTNCLIIRSAELDKPADQFWQEINSRYEQLRHDTTRPLLPPKSLFLTKQDAFTQLNQLPQIIVQESAGKTNSLFATEKLPTLTLEHGLTNPLHALAEFASQQPARILFCAETAGRREIFLNLLKTIELYPKIYTSWEDFITGNEKISITIAPLSQGVLLSDSQLCIIPEAEILGQFVIQQRKRKERTIDTDLIIRNLAELHIGAPVVHIDHGVGRYRGLQSLKVGDIDAEYLTLEYAGNDKLYVPVASLHLISRYSGADLENAPLHRLGTEQWQKEKRKAADRIKDVAAELLDIYAKRAARQGHTYQLSEIEYAKFSNAFPFEETIDQQTAIQQVIEDLTTAKPMDRLICGDVGFGKTEVAMRAAYIVAHGGKQVAILVPTTLLAQQHYQNFKDRFADWPFNIEVISRFRTAQEQSQILDSLKNNKIDILIGTHKLLQTGIRFADLGLVIIDEEHRFGVQQKERLKALRAEIDVLTLTATPIPRTLNMAFSGMRDLSIIATPPARRLAIKTFIHEYDHHLVREAILREILRGGQVYYLHNDVATISKTANELQNLLPEARINIAHGQMREKELEQIMSDFYHQRFNVLVCTTIIETGIDIPSANTIIVERADKFGLAQLHQLRGRVGRSHHQAYAYLLISSHQSLTNDAKKRLDALASLEDLGAGFTLATHDLEIRGAGELLGEEQSGNMHAIGFSLYMEMLEKAVNAIKSGKHIDLLQTSQDHTEIDLHIPALIPDKYLPDVHQRLILYKRIASSTDEASLDDLQVEMIDRFGLLPEACKNLFSVTLIKLHAQRLGIKKIEANEKGGRIEFSAEPNIDSNKLIHLIQSEPNKYKLDGPQRLRYFITQNTPQEKIQNAEKVLKIIS